MRERGSPNNILETLETLQSQTNCRFPNFCFRRFHLKKFLKSFVPFKPFISCRNIWSFKFRPQIHYNSPQSDSTHFRTHGVIDNRYSQIIWSTKQCKTISQLNQTTKQSNKIYKLATVSSIRLHNPLHSKHNTQIRNLHQLDTIYYRMDGIIDNKYSQIQYNYTKYNIFYMKQQPHTLYFRYT